MYTQISIFELTVTNQLLKYQLYTTTQVHTHCTLPKMYRFWLRCVYTCMLHTQSKDKTCKKQHGNP